MTDGGRPAEGGESQTTSPKGGYRPSRGFLFGMAGVVSLAIVLAAAAAVAASRDPQVQTGPLPPPPPVEVTRPPRPVTPEPDITSNQPLRVEPDGGQAHAPASGVSASPTAVASSWSTGPILSTPAPAAAISPSSAWLAQQAASIYGVRIVLEGQDWGDDETAQTENIGAVISAMDVLPVTVTSSIAAHPAGPLALLSNTQGRTEGGWQPYGGGGLSFYTNSDQGPSGYGPSNQVVLDKGADRMTVAHELLHAYQFRNVGPDGYALALLGEEMRSFMAATGWRQTASDEELRRAVHQPWEALSSLFRYEGRPLTYADRDGQAVSLPVSNPIEAFATAGAIYYARPAGMALPDWPEYWDWFRANLG